MLLPTWTGALWQWVLVVSYSIAFVTFVVGLYFVLTSKANKPDA